MASRHQEAPRGSACHVDRRETHPLPVCPPARPMPVRGGHGRALTVMTSSDARLLERLAQLPAVPISDLIELLGRLPNLAKDPILAGLVAVDEEGQAAVHPLLAAVVEHLRQRPDATCYGALIEALTGIWNAAVRG